MQCNTCLKIYKRVDVFNQHIIEQCSSNNLNETINDEEIPTPLPTMVNVPLNFNSNKTVYIEPANNLNTSQSDNNNGADIINEDTTIDILESAESIDIEPTNECESVTGDIDLNISESVTDDIDLNISESAAHNLNKRSCSIRQYYQKCNHLTQVLENIKCLPSPQKKKIIRKSLDSEYTITKYINSNIYNENVATGVIEYLKTYKCYSNKQKETFCEIVRSVCGENLYDVEFFTWFCSKIEKRPKAVTSLLSMDSESRESRRRQRLLLEDQQIIFDTWHENSIVTVDRRNGRDEVKIKKKAYSKFENLKLPEEIELENFKSKRNIEMVKSTRRIYTKSIREILKIVRIKTGHNISLGSVHYLKPFYIGRPTEKEKRKLFV